MIVEMDIEGKLRIEAQAMFLAVQGEDVPGTFHCHNWQEKPHRVVYDAVKLLEEAADYIATMLAQHRVDAINECAAVAAHWKPEGREGKAYSIACQASFEIADAIHALIPANQP